MKSFIYVLTIGLLLTSCGMHSTNFSQRKHMKGHFHKPSGNYKADKSENEKIVIRKNNPKSEKEIDFETGAQTSEIVQEKPHIADSIENSETVLDAVKTEWKEQREFRKKIRQPENVEAPSIEESFPEDNVLLENQKDQTTSNSKRSPRGFENFMILLVVLFFSFVIGLVLLILYFILAANGLVGLWLLVLSCSLIGIPILFLIVFIFIIAYG